MAHTIESVHGYQSKIFQISNYLFIRHTQHGLFHSPVASIYNVQTTQLSNKVDSQLSIANIVTRICRDATTVFAPVVPQLIQKVNTLLLVERPASNVLIKRAQPARDMCHTGNMLPVGPAPVRTGGNSITNLLERASGTMADAADTAG